MKTTRLFHIEESMKSIAKILDVTCLYTGGGLDYYGLETEHVTYYLVDGDGENEIPKTLDESAKIAHYDERDDSNGFSYEGTALECLVWLYKASVSREQIHKAK